MSCCSSSSHPLGRFAPWFPRIALGTLLVSIGVNHYRHLQGFVEIAKVVLSPVPLLGNVMGFFAYFVPAAMIVGGALFAVKQLPWLSKLCILGSLSGIIVWASLAILVGDTATTGSMMPAIQNAAVLIILYYVVRRMSCCGSCVPPPPPSNP